MKLLWSAALSNLSTTYILAQGQWGLFEIRYSGTNASGQTSALADCGNVIINWNGADKWNVDVDLISQLNNVYGGVPEVASTVSAAFAFTIFIPTAAWFDSKNIYDVGANDKVYFKLDFPNMISSLITAGTVNIYGKPRSGVMQYIHTLYSRSVVAGGASTITDTITTNNVIELYVKNPAALTSQMQLTKDNKVYVDGDVASELAYSNWIHLLETSITMLAIEFAESGNVLQAVGQSVTYKYTFTGAGTLAQYYSAIEFTPAKAATSAANAKNS